MTDSVLYKLVLVLAYIIIIILAILFLDLLMKYTTRNNREEKMKNIAESKAKETNKPLIIFDKENHGFVIGPDGKTEEFNGDVVEIADQIKDNSCVLLLFEILEYMDDSQLNQSIEQFKKVSGGDLYSSNFEKNGPRIFWDYKLKNIMDKSFYLPNDQIKATNPNELQKNIQKFYSYIFKVLPYDRF